MSYTAKQLIRAAKKLGYKVKEGGKHSLVYDSIQEEEQVKRTAVHGAGQEDLAGGGAGLTFTDPGDLPPVVEAQGPAVKGPIAGGDLLHLAAFIEDDLPTHVVIIVNPGHLAAIINLGIVVEPLAKVMVKSGINDIGSVPSPLRGEG